MPAAARPYADGRAATWGLHATHVVRSPASRWTGRGIRIAILDTGVDLTHRDLAARVAATRSFASECPVQDVIGHGTHCAGIAAGFEDPHHRRYGIACDAEVYVGRVFDDRGGTTIADVIAGMDWALSNGCQVISMSLGTFHASPVAAFEAAGRRALDADCLVVAAAGNNRSRVVVQPANAESILAVGAVDNRRLARAAKLAGAPRDPAAGAVIHARLGDRVEPGQPLFTLHAQARGELDYALEYVRAQPPIVSVDPHGGFDPSPCP